MKKMKKFLPIVMLLSFGTAANAGGLSTRHQSSLQLTVEPQIVTQTRIGNSYSISGNNVITHIHLLPLVVVLQMVVLVLTLIVLLQVLEQLEQLLVFKMDAQDHLQMMTQHVQDHSPSLNHGNRVTILLLVLLVGVISPHKAVEQQEQVHQEQSQMVILSR